MTDDQKKQWILKAGSLAMMTVCCCAVLLVLAANPSGDEFYKGTASGIVTFLVAQFASWSKGTQ